jgi:hypothetical protein
MAVIQQLFAGIALGVCLVLLLRMLLGERRREKFDAVFRSGWQAARRLVKRTPPPPPKPPTPRDARQAAQDAIKRAARRGQWEGNVYKPDRFGKPDEPDKPPRKPH